MAYNRESYVKRLKEYRENLTPEQEALHAEEARLDVAWQKTDSPKKRKAIKAAHSAIVDRLINFCKFDRRGVNGANSRGAKKKVVKAEFYGEPVAEYKVHLRGIK